MQEKNSLEQRLPYYKKVRENRSWVGLGLGWGWGGEGGGGVVDKLLT